MTKYYVLSGWEVESVEPLDKFVQAYDSIRTEIYELKNCNRTLSLVQMRDSLQEAVDSMSAALSEIQNEDEVIECST